MQYNRPERKVECMCGQFYISPDILSAAQSYAAIPSFIQEELHFGTIYPSLPTLVLIRTHQEIKASIMRFGIEYPKFKKRLINARAETVLEKKMFKNDFLHRRLVVPVQSFYEWNADKEKIVFTLPKEKIMFLAGFYQNDQFILLTRKANQSMESFHHRMPLILKDDQVDEYLSDPAKAIQFLSSGSIPLNHENTNPQGTLF